MPVYRNAEREIIKIISVSACVSQQQISVYVRTLTVWRIGNSMCSFYEFFWLRFVMVVGCVFFKDFLFKYHALFANYSLPITVVFWCSKTSWTVHWNKICERKENRIITVYLFPVLLLHTMVVTRFRTLSQLVALATVWLMKSAIAKKNLRLLGLQPMGGKIWIGGNACVASCTMALNDINSRSDILPDYNLTYDYVDSQVFLMSYFSHCREGFINETLLT